MRPTRIVVLLAALVLVAGCKKKKDEASGAGSTGVTQSITLGEKESPPPGPCEADKDCVLVQVPKCCACCPGSGISGVAKGAPKYQRKCDGDCKRCGGGDDCVRLKLHHPLSDYNVACREGRCVALLKDAGPDASMPADSDTDTDPD
jgi:hypothetical protein